jgi:hypothetical protein
MELNMRVYGIVLCICILLLSSAAFVKGADEGMMIPALYGGVITNKATFSDSHGDTTIKDTGYMTGMYFQWIKPGLFQGNLFGYWAPDVNYSRVLGLHGNFDGYFLSWGFGSLVAGVDIEDININMKAGSHFAGLNKFNMTNNILFGMARAGARFYSNQSSDFSVSVFPYLGATRELVDIDMTQRSPYQPPSSADKKISSSDAWNYLSWGTNVTVRAYHFIELTVKYLGRAKAHEYMNSFTGQLNVYVTHSVVLSYQYKYMETSKDGYNAYHLLGAGYVF